jgi:hypothetical protein
LAYAQFTLGHADLSKLSKTTFLCSSKVPVSVVSKCYDRAIEQRETRICVFSGFHNQIEKDVLHYLLKGRQPIIVALARGLKEKLATECIKPPVRVRLRYAVLLKGSTGSAPAILTIPTFNNIYKPQLSPSSNTTT